MYYTDRLQTKQLEKVAAELREETEEEQNQSDIDIYLNSKPSTWRLISHTIANFQHWFIWQTGD